MEKSMREVLPTESLRQKIKRSNSQSDLNDYSSDEVSRSMDSPGNIATLFPRQLVVHGSEYLIRGFGGFVNEKPIQEEQFEKLKILSLN